MNLAKAINLAAAGFLHKTDRAGEPYIFHCLRVMMNPKCNTEVKKILAMLHDTVEDDIYTFDEISAQGFSSDIVRKLQLFTHKEGEEYDNYIKRLSNDDDAVDVKLADLEDNSQITRLKGLGKKDFDRMEKYHRAYVYLSRR